MPKYRKKPIAIEAYQIDHEMDIQTLEGVMHASVGDYIITGIEGEQYPCKKEIFEKTYEKCGEIEIEGGGHTWWHVCPNCHGSVDKHDLYCKHCGGAITW